MTSSHSSLGEECHISVCTIFRDTEYHLTVGFRPHLQLFSELLLLCLRRRRAKLAVVVVSFYEFAVLCVGISECDCGSDDMRGRREAEGVYIRRGERKQGKVHVHVRYQDSCIITNGQMNHQSDRARIPLKTKLPLQLYGLIHVSRTCILLGVP